MPTRNAELDRLLSGAERLENATARQVAEAYAQARRELIDRLLARWTGTTDLTPEQAAGLFQRLGLAQQIDQRLTELERQVGESLRGAINTQTEASIETMRRELALLPPTYRPGPTGDLFNRIPTRMIERFIPVVTADARLGTATLTATLTREYQVGLIQGESFDSLTRRVFAATTNGETGASPWRNGMLSAERMTRRTVITAGNASHQEAIGAVAQVVPEVQKQAIAVIGPNTTDCCIRVHGQIQPVDQPFVLEGTPRFADRMMTPSFHWNCRSVVTMWHPVFEQTAPTAKMVAAADAELARRRAEGSAKSGNE